jgi:hypothetical protein
VVPNNDARLAVANGRSNDALVDSAKTQVPNPKMSKISSMGAKWWSFVAALCLVSFLVGCLTVSIVSSDRPASAYEVARDFQTFAAACVAFAGVFCGSLIAIAKMQSDEVARKEAALARSQAYFSRIQYGARSMALCARLVVTKPGGEMLRAVWNDHFSKRCHEGIDHAKTTLDAIWSSIGDAHPGTLIQLSQALSNLNAMVQCTEELCDAMDDQNEDFYSGDLYQADSRAFHVLRAMDRIADRFGMADVKPARAENLEQFRASIGSDVSDAGRAHD